MLNMLYQWAFIIVTYFLVVQRSSSPLLPIITKGIYLVPFLLVNLWSSSILLDADFTEQRKSVWWWPLYFFYPIYILAMIPLAFVVIFALPIFYILFSATRIHILYWPVFFKVISTFFVNIYNLLKRNLNMLPFLVLTFALEVLLIALLAGLLGEFFQKLGIIIFVLFLGISSILLIRPRFCSYQSYRVWKKTMKKVKVTELIPVLAQIGSSRYSEQVIKDVRENKLLEINDSEITTLKNLITYLSIFRSAHYNPDNDKAYLEALDTRLFAVIYPEKEKIRITDLWESKVIDEFCKLYEQSEGKS
jgi:hypothetical protein